MAFVVNQLQLNLLKTLLHTACLIPAGWVFWQGTQDQLGADPVKSLIHFYGIGAIHCLFATLLMAPLSRWFKTPVFIQCRRLLGLYAFFYACLHMLSFMAFEWQWNWPEIGAEIIKRPYMTVGLLAWVITFALALTSLKAIQRRMGKRWSQLHSLVYLLLFFALLHFYWSQKSPWNQAVLYAAGGTAILLTKRKKLWLWFELFKQKPQNK